MANLDPPSVQPLYPGTVSQPSDLKGLYLSAELPANRGNSPWIAANFVTSLDGRIALDQGGGCRVPEGIANARDWRLFQELAARADCLITSGRYLRDLQTGSAQDVLPLGHEFDDLRAWRISQGLPPQPDVVVVSGGVDYTLPPDLTAQRRRVYLMVPQVVNEASLEVHCREGAKVLDRYPGQRVTGARLRQALAGAGYRRAYSVAGPQIAHTLMADGSLDTLFLTQRYRAIGGNPGTYETITEGDPLMPPAEFTLQWLYLDPAGGQHFLRLDSAAIASGKS